MKSRKLVFFLHFIIFSFAFLSSSSLKESSQYSCPNYFILNFSKIFSEKNISKPLSIWTKEYIYSNISKIFSEFPYFISTSKNGIISVISKNKTLFSIDFNKKMYKTNFNQENVIKGDNVILPMEGKLFRMKTHYEKENFEEITNPIRYLVDMTPFSLWFNQDYYFTSDKKYSMFKIKNRNIINDEDIKLDKIIFVDFNLVCLKDKIEVWNTFVTNVYFLEEENDFIYDKNLEENMIIYENNDVLEKYMKQYFGDDYNDILYIHGYDKNKKRYIKLYDYNSYIHWMQNNTVDHNFEEQYIHSNLNNNDNEQDIINAFEYNNKIIYPYDIDLIMYYCIVFLIIIWAIVLLLNNFIYKTIFSLEVFFKNLFSIKSKNNNQKIINENINKIGSISHVEIFSKIQNYFNPKSRKKDSLKLIRVSILKDIKSIKIIERSSSSDDLKSEINKDFALYPTAKAIIKRNSKILKELGITNDKQKSEFKLQTRLEKDFKDISFLKKSIFRNSIDVILKAKHKIDEQLYAIKIKKLTNPNEEQSIIAEAQNMKKIRSKHIVEYITCWLDSSVGDLEYLFNENKEKKEEKNDDVFFSSKSNSKVPEKNNFKTFVSKDEIKKDHFKENLYNKKSFSDDESSAKKINLDNKFYEMNDIKEENNKKMKTKIEYKDDSLINIKKSENQKNLTDLSIYFFIQMEYCQEMTLAQYIQNNSNIKIKNKVIYTFTYQLIKSLAKIHAKNIIHANINPENIFVINEESIKIGDFSSAKDIELKFKKNLNNCNKVLSQSYQNIMEINDNEEIETNHREGSLYSSPEQKKGSGISKKSDIYSVGLVLYEMCECFNDDEKRNKKIKYLKKYKTFEDKFQKDYELQCNLILQMIEDDEDKRPSCEELLESKEMQTWKSSISEN